MFEVFQLLHLGCLLISHLNRLLLCSHLSCIIRGSLILWHPMLEPTQCQQCHPSNSGRTIRYSQSNSLLVVSEFSLLCSMVFHLVLQASSEGFQPSGQNQLPPLQTDQSLGRSDVSHECEISVDGQAICSDHVDHISQGSESISVISSSTVEAQVL